LWLKKRHCALLVAYLERPNDSPRVGVPHHLIDAFSITTVTIE